VYEPLFCVEVTQEELVTQSMLSLSLTSFILSLYLSISLSVSLSPSMPSPICHV
jgi:hypothetical protein